MSDKDIFSIIDYGSSKLRLGIFENYPPFNKFLIKENVLNGDCLTITGKSLWENVEDYQNLRFFRKVKF